MEQGRGLPGVPTSLPLPPSSALSSWFPRHRLFAPCNGVGAPPSGRNRQCRSCAPRSECSKEGEDEREGRAGEMGTHRLGATSSFVPVCVYPSQPGLEASVAELGAPAAAVIQFSNLGDQERGDLDRKNQVLAGAWNWGERQSPLVSRWPLS